MDKLPFNPYDFFGYLASGLVILVGMQYVVGFPHVLGRDLKAGDTALIVLATYVAGQLVATPAKAVLEDGLIGRILGRPNTTLLRDASMAPRWRRVFPGFYNPLPEATRACILERARAEGINEIGEPLFLHVRFAKSIRDDEKLMRRLDAFLASYGFSRNLSFSCFAVGIAIGVSNVSVRDPLMWKYATTALVASVLLFYRYLKFFRQYSYELFNTYARSDAAAGALPLRKEA